MIRCLLFLVNFSLQPDVIGGGKGTEISADWPGVVCNTLAAVYGERTVGLYVQGTCGDINHVPHEETALPTRGPAKAEQDGVWIVDRGSWIIDRGS